MRFRPRIFHAPNKGTGGPQSRTPKKRFPRNRRIIKQNIEVIDAYREHSKTQGPGIVIKVSYFGAKETEKILVIERPRSVAFFRIDETGKLSNIRRNDLRIALEKNYSDIRTNLLRNPSQEVIAKFASRTKLRENIKIGIRGTGTVIETPIGLFAILRGNIFKKVKGKFSGTSNEETALVNGILKIKRS